MPNRNDVIPNDSIIRINPGANKNINIEILKNQEEKIEENSNEEINKKLKFICLGIEGLFLSM